MTVAADADRFATSAFAAFNANNPAQAEADCRRALALLPDHIGALTLLGYIQALQGRSHEAVPVFDKLCRLDPNEASHWLNLGNAYRGSGEPDDALKALARAAELGEKSADFHFNLGLTHIARGDFESARSVLEDALKLAPHDTDTLHQYVVSCYESTRFDLALKALDNWTPAPDAPPATVAAIAQLLLNLGEFARAATAVQHAIMGAPSAPVMLTHVQILERTNQLDEANMLLQRLTASPEAAALGPELQRVAAKNAQRHAQHELAVELYRQALVDYGKLHEQHFILYPLAESLHALGRYDETIHTLIDAHRSQVAFIRRARPLAALRGSPQMEVTNYSCDPADVARWDHSGAPAAADSPVFVVAFPRSGTTLLELTLDAHPLLRSMDEQPFVQNALEDIVSTGVVYPERLGELTAAQLEGIRKRYWQRTRTKVELAPGQRLVDKNPLNLLRLPVMRRIFPNAPILLAIRHPCDVILSCYRQHFRAPDFAMLCSDMADLTLGYRKAFDFWYEQVELLQPRVLEVRYEDFVSDFPVQVRQIAEFLELPWDAAMLTPAAQAHAKRYISTPSYSQVVQPVNSKSVGRWQAYRRYLEPAFPILKPYLERWHYQV